MSLEADVIVDRRRLRRKLTYWRILAFVGILTTFFITTGYFIGLTDFHRNSDHIARLSISGFISEDLRQLRLIKDIKESESVKGVIVSINSPGGSTAGSEALYNALRDLAEEKPIVSQIGALGASGGYMVALASDYIIARHNTITGSIGVLFQYGNATDLLNTIGISVDSVKSSPLKAEPNFYQPIPHETRTMLSELVNDMYDWFVGLVAERRELNPLTARQLSDGRIFTGNQAKSVNLIDEIGDEKNAIEWLASKHNVDKELPVLEWVPEYDSQHLLFSDSLALFISKIVNNIFFGGSNSQPGLIPPYHAGDGMLSVWQVHIDGSEKFLRGGNQ